jgi:hypothetical protein
MAGASGAVANLGLFLPPEIYGVTGYQEKAPADFRMGRLPGLSEIE